MDVLRFWLPWLGNIIIKRPRTLRKYKVRGAIHFAVTDHYFKFRGWISFEKCLFNKEWKVNFRRIPLKSWKKTEFQPIYLKMSTNLRISFWIWSKNYHQIKYLERKCSPIHLQSIFLISAKENFKKIKFKLKCALRMFARKSYL